jgi:DNA-binding CsgD family transcriptional regulator
VRDRTIFQEVAGTLANGLSALSGFRAARLSTRELENVLRAVSFPVFLLSSSGRLLFVNQAARETFPKRPEWMSQAHLASAPLPSWVRRVSIRASGSTLILLIVDVFDDDPNGAPESAWAQRWALPPRHARVAACMLKGLTDKETAARLGLEVSTVRTYVKHVLARARVHSRTELMRAALSLSRARR